MAYMGEMVNDPGVNADEVLQASYSLSAFAQPVQILKTASANT